jgi:hypothetical protein
LDNPKNFMEMRNSLVKIINIFKTSKKVNSQTEQKVSKLNLIKCLIINNFARRYYRSFSKIFTQHHSLGFLLI